MLSRLARIPRFNMRTRMIVQSGVSPRAVRAIDTFLLSNRISLNKRVRRFLTSLNRRSRDRQSPASAHTDFFKLRLRFNQVLEHLDLFSDAFAQRCEPRMGSLMAGMDCVARQAIAVEGATVKAPPLICYLDRGWGGAIRRARTKLPGGDQNPVAIIRLPRERMVCSAAMASLVHEVGHQGSANLDLIDSLRGDRQFRAKLLTGNPDARYWHLFSNWMSEICSDFWALARLGIAATYGLMSVVSLPRAFVFRLNPNDPHPFPWIRVLISCALGQALFPQPQWGRLRRLWKAFYPLKGLPVEAAGFLAGLENALPEFVEFFLSHRPKALRGLTLPWAFRTRNIQLAALRKGIELIRGGSALAKRTAPTTVIAAIGQARADRRISPEEESRLLAKSLNEWAASGRTAAVHKAVTSAFGSRQKQPNSLESMARTA